MSRTTDPPPTGLPDSAPGKPWVGAHTLRPPAARPDATIDLREPPEGAATPGTTATVPGQVERATPPPDAAVRPGLLHRTPAVPAPRVDAIAVVALAVLTAVSARHLLDTGSLSAADANHALAAKASSLHELGVAAFADLGHGALLALVLRVSGGSILAGQMMAFAATLAASGLVYLAARRLALHRAGALLAGVAVACSARTMSGAGTLGSGALVTFFAALLMFQGAGVLAAEDRDDLRRRMLTLGATTVAGSVTALLVVPAAATVWAVVFAGSARRFGFRTLARPAMVAIDLAVVYVLFVLPGDAGSSLRDGTATGGHLVGDRGLGELLRSLGRAIERALSGFAPSTLADRGLRIDAALGAAVVVGTGVLLTRRARGASLVVLPLLVAVGLAVAHVVPLGSPADAWVLPALAVGAAAAADPLLRSLRAERTATPAVALVGLVLALWAAPRPAADATPALEPVARVLAAVPASDCAVLNGVEPAAFHWATTWDLDLVGRVRGGSVVKVGYPNRCVSFPGADAERFDRTVRTTTGPESAVVWWVQPAGETSIRPPAEFTVAGRQVAGSYEVLRLQRR